ncbi:hypothetical protein HNR23_004746 [Nocardiopsis mwathae]|uniref:Uncharacterized protein n=1 Tax=Nocardiopsis mwathae TaxID=1472723 RepID=A0A7W9YP73_9ACTN|nr:T3SS effector HopA1 family protein [Nocardiopsis mwathae]MBB6174686.1 hypothetical protein [Nocardiopsis mwathae]
MTGVNRSLLEALHGVELEQETATAGVGEDRIAADSTRELQARLAAAFYGQWHVGNPLAQETSPGGALYDQDLADLLRSRVPHEAASVTAQVRGRDGSAAVVVLDGLRVAVPSDALPEDASPGDPVELSIDPVRPALSPGFLLADSSRGRPSGGPLLRCYVHIVDAVAAPDIWGTCLSILEDVGVPYRAKVLSRRAAYPRRDAFVAYLRPDAGKAVFSLSNVSSLPGVGHATSVFTHQIAPGVAFGWDPDDPRSARHRRRSFGEHRSAVLAEALIEHAASGSTALPLTEHIADALRAAGIDPTAPHRNLSSPRIEEDKPLSC